MCKMTQQKLHFFLFSGQTMANFGGHAIPGSFFLLYGFWLTVKHILQHYWRTSQPKGRQVMPPFFKRMDYVEGGFKVFASFVGQFPFKSILIVYSPLKIYYFFLLETLQLMCILWRKVLCEGLTPRSTHVWSWGKTNASPSLFFKKIIITVLTVFY